MDKAIWASPKVEKSLEEAQVPLWFWNDELETNEIIRQLKMQTEVGVTCTNPHARTLGGEGYTGGYLDEQWMQDISTVLDYKKEHNEKMWLYDEIDWPAGTCNQTITKDENNREQYITIDTVAIPKGEKYRAQLSDFEGKSIHHIVPMGSDANGMVFNINIVKATTGEKYDLRNYFSKEIFGPELEFCADEDAIAYITKVRVDTFEAGGNLQVNYLDAEVTKKFLKSTHDKYYEAFGKDFGSTITTVFNDETRMCHAIAWCNTFATTFFEQKGYDIREEAYQLILQGEQAGRIRCDYFDVLAYLYQNNYFGELSKWCKERNLKLYAHLLGEETLFGHVRYSGDYMRQSKYQDVCGADHLGKGIGSLNIKFTSSGAHSYGKNRTAVEVFANCGWDMTFEEYIRMITWQFQQGMQTIINHGFFYSDRGERKNDWPPSQFFQWQGWKHQSAGNDMVRRLYYAFSEGVNEADILVYMPTESFWLHYLPNQHYTHAFAKGPFTKGKKAAYIDANLQLFLNELSSENMDFELIHKDAIANFKVQDGKIINELNGQKFSALVLPMCEVLPVEMARLCEQFAADGGTIVALDELPRLSMSQQDDAEVCATMQKLYERGDIIIKPADQRAGVIQTIEQVIPHPIKIVNGTNRTINNHPKYDTYLIDPYLHAGEDLSGVLFARYLKDGKRNTLFMNYGSKPEVIEVAVKTAGTIPETWNTFTGEIAEAEVVEKIAKGYIVKLELPCNYGILLVSE